MQKKGRQMKKFVLPSIFFILSLSLCSISTAGGCKLTYKLKPGQKWMGYMSSQSESRFMEKDNVTRSKTRIEYTVLKGPKKNWVTLNARIVSMGKKAGKIDLSRVVYSADVHQSGEIRNVNYTGDAMPDLGEQAAQMPPETLAMIKQSFKMVPDAWKNMVFWFPEVPEEKLQEGDEFEFERKMVMGAGTPFQMQTLNKQVFILEEVSKGFAYFSVEDRSITKGNMAMGMDTKTKMAGRGEAVFDLEQGMWLELTEKARTRMNMGGYPGGSGKDHNMRTVFKFEMERL